MGMIKGQKQYGVEFTNQIMKIHYEEGKSIRETAKILNVSFDVTRNAINRQSARLKKT